MSTDILNTPMSIGSCEIKNRIVMPPMHLGFADFDGKPTEMLMDYYERRAKGGAGLIITEITRVNDKTGAAAFAQLSASSDENIEPLGRLAKRVQRHGAKLFVQLHHPGRQNVGLVVGTVPISIKMQRMTGGAYGRLLYSLTPTLAPAMLKHNLAPCAAAPSKCPPAQMSEGRVRALRHSEIKQLEKDFISAAVRVFKAGCDGVELHAAHGYLLQQFLSPYTNRRTDEYGGSLENRMRFILNIIKGIKTECGKSFPVIVRLSVDECYAMIGHPERGYGLEQGVEMAKILEKAGVDAIDVSCAGYDTMNYWLEPVSFEPGWRKYMAKAVKQAVSIPVIAANLIRSPQQAREQLESGIQDFVSLGRPQIADPDWANKAISGKGVISRCICCLNCMQSMHDNAFRGSHGECSVNPFVGKEGIALRKNGEGRSAAVIGAGPAGLTCAKILAMRGFEVTVIEKNDRPGGQLLLASAPPEKGKTAWFIEDAAATLESLGVKLMLSTEATAELIEKMQPNVVVVAAGSSPIIPKLEGSGADNVYTFEQVLNGSADIKDEEVAVIGSGLTGLETAQQLCENGCRVIMVEMAGELAPGAWFQHKLDILPKLEKAGTVFLTGEKLCEIHDGYIVTENTKTGQKMKTNCDSVVLSLGSRPRGELIKQLRSRLNVNVYAIGDCDKPGNIADATRAAYEIAVGIE